MASDSYSSCLTKIDQFLGENDQLYPCWQTWFVDTHLKLLRVFACYTGKWSDEDKDKYLVSLPTDHRELVAQINSNNFCDYVARFVFPKAGVGFENEPKLRFKDSYVSLKFQADIATTLKYLLRSTHPPIGDVLVFSQFAASVHDYVASLWLEFQEYVECGMLTYSFIYSEVEGNYKAVARELGYLKSSISTLPDKEKFQDLLSRAGAVFLRAAIVACDNQFIDRDAWLFATDMALHSRKLISVVRNGEIVRIYREVLGVYIRIIEATKPSSSSSRGHIISSTSTLEELVESCANHYQSLENRVNVLLSVVDNLWYSPVVQKNLNHELKLLCNGVLNLAMKATSFNGSTPNIVLSKLWYKLNLIKAEFFVLELQSLKTKLMICTHGHHAAISNAFKLLGKFFKTPEVYMEEREKYILALIEALLREEAREPSNGSRDQNQKFTQEDMISKSSLNIFRLFKAEAMLLAQMDIKTTMRFLEKYCLEILQKSLIFLRALLDLEDVDLYTLSETINLVFSLGGGDDKMKDMSLLPNSFSSMVKLHFAEIRTVHQRCPWLLSTFPKSDGPVFADFLLKKLRECLEENPYSTIALLKDQAQVLLQELQYLQSFIKDVRKRRIDESEDLEVARMICLIYEAEYIIINLFEDAGVPVWYKHLVLLNAISEAKLIRSEIQKYHHRHKEKRDRGNIHNVARHTLEGVNDSRTNQVIVGFEDRARDIIDQLTTGSSRRQIVSIVGMGGIGKTTLAMKVYNNLSIQHHFRDRAWCTVSQVYNKRELLLEVLGCIAEITEQIKKMGDDDIANKLRQSLKGKRYLVVMDDMWSIEAWTDLQMSFPDDAKGSRILFTSRNSEMALERQPYHLPLLNAEESLNLFNEKLFHGGICPKELLGVGRFIVENCQGLPLAIVIMAGILEKVKKRKDCWAEIAEHLMSHIAHDGGDTRFVDILEFSYNHLPTHLKPCFLYLGMFREDQYIPVQKLKLMWIAEGFVPKKDSKSLEETAEEYLVELIARNLVMEAQKRSRGGAKTCHMHDMVHYLCLEKSREENFMQLITTRTDGGADLGDSCSSIVSSSYRTCFQLTLEQLRAQHQSLDPHVRSLLFFPTISNQDKFVSRPLQLQDAKFLRLLDMVYVQIVPLSLEEFIWMRCLKYLAVSGDFSSVPSSIVQLVDLETLILKGNAKTIDVSTKLWSMGKLRHVQVTFISHSSLPGPEIECQGNIVSLSWLTFGRSTSSRGETFLRRFTGIKKLKCQFQRERGSDPEEGYPIPAMDALYQLESLHLFRSPVSWRRSTVSFPGKFRFPANLKKLTLSSFDLSSRCISTIGQQLSNLEVLKLRKCYWMDSVWSVAEGEFLNLKYLQIYDFDIVIWNASADSFPLLERLVLLHCYHLQEIPSSFGEVPTLQVIQMNTCKKSAYKSAERISEQQHELGNEEFKVLITG